MINYIFITATVDLSHGLCKFKAIGDASYIRKVFLSKAIDYIRSYVAFVHYVNGSSYTIMFIMS